MRRWVAEHPGWPDQGRQLWEEAEEARITRHSWQSMQNRWRRYLKPGRGPRLAAAAAEPSRRRAAEASAALCGASPRPPLAKRIRRSLAGVGQQRAPGPPPAHEAPSRPQRTKRWASPFGPAARLRQAPPAWEPSLQSAKHHSCSLFKGPAAAQAGSVDLPGSAIAGLPHADEDSSVAECSPGSEIVEHVAALQATHECAERLAMQSADFTKTMQQRSGLGDDPVSHNGELLAPGGVQDILAKAPPWLRERQLDVHIDPEEL